jgi:cell fate regulator YaaT (PSP1 superfamily)
MTTSRVLRVEFGAGGRYQYCSPGDEAVQTGDMVVVETDWGVGMGQVGSVLDGLEPAALKSPVRRVVRKATATDLSRRTALAQREREARAFCRERIRVRALPMKLSEVRIGLDSSKALFYFTAEGRVDFRELVKDLVQHLRTRVELRQIGVRDEAKVLACSGACGRAVCCRGVLQAFAPVSIRMAKDQNLALNPAKLSGICGRLKCCLIYEHAVYAELRKGLAKVGSHVMTAHGPGAVRAQNILDQTLQIGLETGGQVTVKAAEVSLRPRPEQPPKAREGRPPAARREGRPGPLRSQPGPADAAPPGNGENGNLAALED